MNNTLVAPSLVEMNELKDQISEQKRAVEYKKLKKDLEEITLKAVNTPNDIDGAMQMPDTDRLLVTKRTTHPIVEQIVSRAAKMCAIQPIIGSVIGIILAVLGMILLLSLNTLALEHDISWVQKALPYLTKSSITAIAGVIVLSASRSLLLPLLGMVLALAFCSMLQGNDAILYYGFNDFLILGVASFMASLFSAIAIR